MPFEVKLLTVIALGKSHNSFLDIEPESQEQSEAEREAQRDKARHYLTKCVEEISYLLQPPAHPPPTHAQLQSLDQNAFMSQGGSAVPLEEAYLQQQRQRGQHGLPQQAPIPNHQPPPVPSVADMSNFSHGPQMPQQAPFMSREPAS